MTDLAQRYGTDRSLRRPLTITVAVLVAATGVAWVAWAAVFHGSPAAHSQLVSFDPPQAHAVSATVRVVREDPAVPASCLLRASAADHSIVGELNFTVDSSDPAAATLTKRIRTEREATAVELLGCVTEGQNNRR